jgi:hypothetical protein
VLSDSELVATIKGYAAKERRGEGRRVMLGLRREVREAEGVKAQRSGVVLEQLGS